ncbi:uncharacterized protein EV422DRAFT_531982 [Fimicolochytrium jonesii]|uniref:uncharacterized protein n=1 Tax=Fimicolochytrium jonesii TaxID=1396493 RepID=UPI0022FF297F|nr:uncharacterized protein EV422DRAFT_531982 [Fimicolochytrium jonesii]KAI8820195.1 hypothetical protein EV422DRAFT_531982 [Fimicolochytrium jonesii]
MSFKGIPRPTRTEDEDDLLRLQSVFAEAAASSTPAAKVQRRSQANGNAISVPSVAPLSARKKWEVPVGGEKGAEEREEEGAPKKKKSLFAERRAQRKAAEETAAPVEDSAPESDSRFPTRPIESADQGLDRILSDIVERESSAPTAPVLSTFASPTTGFPQVLHRQQRESRPKRETTIKAAVVDDDGAGKDGDAKGIHEENVKVIEGMSEREIEEAREEIMAKLDPGLIAFLKARRGKKGDGEGMRSESGDKKEMHVPAMLEKNSSGKHVSFSDDIDEKAKPSTVATSEGPQGEHPAWIPADKLEVGKLQWMLDSTSDTATSALTSQSTTSEIRFDLSGRIIAADSNIPHHLGLHHHGDAPERAGYTLDEMLTLARSTAPSQRAPALRMLGAVIANIYNCTYDPDPLWTISGLLLSKDYLIILRAGLDDSHDTVIASSLAGIAAVLGCGSLTDDGEEHLWDRLALSSVGHRTHAISVAQQRHFAQRATGRPSDPSDAIENDGSLHAIMQLMRFDALTGLIHTHLLVRLTYLLQSRLLSPAARNDILAILIRVCRHSRTAAADVAECEGLISYIHAHFLCQSWPGTDVDSEILRVNALKIVRLLCQSGRDVAESLVQHGIVQDALRYIVADVGEMQGREMQAMGWRVQTEVWLLLTGLFAMRVNAAVFDAYRGALFDRARDMFSRVGREGDEDVKTAAMAFTRMISVLFTSFGQMLDVGGADDALRPFAEVVVDAYEQIGGVEDDLLFASMADFLAAYLRRLGELAPGKLEPFKVALDKISQKQTSSDPLASTLSRLAMLIDRLAERTTLASSRTSHLHFIGLRNGRRVVLAETLVDINVLLDALTARLRLTLAVKSSGSKRPEGVIDASTLLHRIFLALRPHVPHADPIRCFLPAWPHLLFEYISASKPLQQSDKDKKADDAARITRCSIALAALPTLLPGDEYIAGKLLNTHILHRDTLAALYRRASSSSAHADSPAMRRLQDMLDYQFYSDASLLRSEGVYARNSRVAETLLMEAEPADVSLPLRMDWMFSIFETLLSESQKYAHLMTQARKTGGRVREDADDVVAECLRLIQVVEGVVDKRWYADHLPNTVKLARLMCVFLLPSAREGDELFAREEVDAMLNDALYRYTEQSSPEGSTSTSTSQQTLETALGGRARFYHLYTALLTHFAAVSYGNATFAHYLLLPLSMSYPADYRLLFCNELFELLRLFTIATPDVRCVGGQSVSNAYWGTVETDEAVLGWYVRAVAEGKVTKDGTPFLWDVAVGQLCKVLLSGDEGEVEKTRRNVARRMKGLLGEGVDEVLRWGGVREDGVRNDGVSAEVFEERKRAFGRLVSSA